MRAPIHALDPFGGKSYETVVNEQFGGVKMQQELSSGRRIAVAVIPPAYGTEKSNELIAQLPAFPNPIQRKYWKEGVRHTGPNQIALRAAAIANAAGVAVAAFGQPGICSDGYGSDDRETMLSGNFAPFVRDIFEVIQSTEAQLITVFGFSEGGTLAPQVALRLLEEKYEVDAVVVGSPPTVDQNRGVVQLGFDYADPDVMKQISQLQEVSPAVEFAQWGKDKGAVINSALMGLQLLSRILRPTSYAMARGMSFGNVLHSEIPSSGSCTLDDQLQRIQRLSPQTVIRLMSGEFDRVAPPKKLGELATRLSLGDEAVEVFAGLNHSAGDDIAQVANLVARARAAYKP